MASEADDGGSFWTAASGSGGASDDGGSFWTTFGGPLGGGAASQSSFEQLLQMPDCSLEALLDEEEVIQEFKAENERLVQRLSKPDAVKALFEFITCEPPEEASSKRCYRYPFIAVELMTCGPSRFFQAIVRADQPDILDKLWDFMESTPAADVNPVLAGYFMRAASSIFSKHPAQVGEYLRNRGADALLQRFLERLHVRSLAELLARLLCAEHPSHVVFQADGLVELLLKRLEDSGMSNDTQENVTVIFQELLTMKDQICCGDEILQQLIASSAVSFLVDHIFSGSPGSVPAATSILSNAVIHSYVAVKGISVCASTPTLSPVSPPPVPLLGEEDIVNVGAEDSVVGEAAAAVRATSSPPHSPSTPSKPECPSMWLEVRSAQLMRELCSQLPRLRAILDASLERTSPLPSPGGEINAIGSTTLEVLGLLAMLARTGCTAILEALLQEQLLPRCLELLFRHPWSSLLHNTVKLTISEIFSTSEGAVRPALVLAFLRDSGLVERVVSEFTKHELEVKTQQGASGRIPCRVGYMGHLHSICCELEEYGLKVPECGAALQAISGWSDIVLPALEATHRVHEEKLGGGVQPADRGLAASEAGSSSQVAPSFTEAPPAVKSGLEQDFVLDDLNDLEDDFGPPVIPVMSGTGPEASKHDAVPAPPFDPEQSWVASFDSAAAPSGSTVGDVQDASPPSAEGPSWSADFGLMTQSSAKNTDQPPEVDVAAGPPATANSSLEDTAAPWPPVAFPAVDAFSAAQLPFQPSRLWTALEDNPSTTLPTSTQGADGDNTSTSATVPPNVGTENLFALLGQDEPSGAVQGQTRDPCDVAPDNSDSSLKDGLSCLADFDPLFPKVMDVGEHSGNHAAAPQDVAPAPNSQAAGNPDLATLEL
mmetsp:Transcript_8420/g.15833  ORF Transcript_8420/g.15833 Transcript_8420/m.15833 type:complete len:886 (+) Transcript_8420:37-2694(+)|eukprot:CAMPEP_0172872196 /NCGR_PEP_ID=MMETSP1075-20121228/92500_1 /TAXON_ID=2916 /ORGANISM="Ceratium fusus, Strain PA161109" /LENGTH=885 /DNA_ID=CAMNT_0013722505 /DNA_START=36 /DNA_END=2693 /DNA_ORIENTATION=+